MFPNWLIRGAGEEEDCCLFPAIRISHKQKICRSKDFIREYLFMTQRLTVIIFLTAIDLIAEQGNRPAVRVEAEAKEVVRQGDVSIRSFEWASRGKAVWLRNAGDSISFVLPTSLAEGYYKVRLRGRSLSPLSHGYHLEAGETKERLSLSGERQKVGGPTTEVAWFETMLFLKPKSAVRLFNSSAWALIDVVTFIPGELKEKLIEAEALKRKGKTSLSKAEWASGDRVAWLTESWSSLTYGVGGIKPGNYRVEIKVRDHPSLRRGYFLSKNGFAAYLDFTGKVEPVPAPMQKMAWLQTELHLQQGDQLKLFHLRAYGAVDCIRIIPTPGDPIVEVPESDPPTASVSVGQRHPALHPVTFHEPAKHQPVWLVRDGKAAASIVVSPRIDKLELFKSITNGFPFSVHAAARELREHVEVATGVSLPILIDRMPKRGNAILVGASRFTDGLGLKLNSLGKSGFAIRTFPGKVVIAGRDGNLDEGLHKESGTLWGVHDFLERFVGVRWYYPGELGRVVPGLKDLAVPPVHITDEPHFKKRRIWRYHGVLRNTPSGASSAVMGARFRNEDVSGVPSSSHTFGEWRKLYGKTHPEYFEMGKDGTRKSSQLCFSEPGVLKQMLTNLKADERKVIQVSPIDVSLKCQCKTCLSKVSNRSFLYEYSQVMGEFVHSLATEVKKRWPEKAVFYLAYQNYVGPPAGLEFPDNVSVMVCGMRTIANYKEPEIYRDEREIFDGWQRILKRPASHWHYLCWPDDCTAAPFQFRHVLKEFFTRYAGTTGCFVDSGIDWSRKHLTVYLLSRLLWNPEFDVDAAFDEYCRLMYGPASEQVARIYGLLTDKWETSRWSHPLPPYHRISLKNVHVESYPPDVVKELRRLYTSALGAVKKDSIEARRIRFFGISLEAFFKESDAFHRSSARRKLNVRAAKSLPTIDGKLDDKEWKECKESEFLRGYDAAGGAPEIRTTVRAVWSSKGIVLGLTAHEPDMGHLKANKTGHDEQVYMDDCFEIFIDSRGELGDYYQIVTNSKGAIFDASSIADPYSSWNCAGLKVGIAKSKGAWTAEVFIPFKGIGATNVKPGSFWFGNITRSRWRKGLELSRYHTVDVPPIKTSNLNMLHFAQIVFE